MTLHKVHGLANPADLVTKHLNQHMAAKHLEILDMWTEGGRAETAPTLSALAEPAQQEGLLADGWLVMPSSCCELAEAAVETIRVHREPRTELFTPLRVPGAPRAAQLIPARLTRGEFLDTGEKFQMVDCWTRRDGGAHKHLGRKWVGTTTFWKKSIELI